MVLLGINQHLLNQVWTNIYPHIPYFSEITSVLQPFFQNPIPSTALVFLISLFSNISIFPARRGYTTYSAIIVDVAYDSFSIFNRMLVFTTYVANLPGQIERRSKALHYEPFTFPTSLPLIIQKSIRNIENKECNVTQWSYLVNDVKDIEALKNIIYMQKDIPIIVRTMCRGADARTALKVISESRPILYLGTIDNRCAVVGRIEWDSYKKLFRGQFFFDNQHVRNEFKSIAEVEISEQKKLKQQIPSNLIDLIKKLEKEE